MANDCDYDEFDSQLEFESESDSESESESLSMVMNDLCFGGKSVWLASKL